MRRTAIFALAFALLLCAACGQEGAEPTPVPSMEPSAAPEQTGPVVEIPDEPYSYLTNEYEWFTLGDAYAAAMEPYETWHEYKYDKGTTLLIAPKETLADVSFYTMDMDEEGVFIPGEVFLHPRRADDGGANGAVHPVLRQHDHLWYELYRRGRHAAQPHDNDGRPRSRRGLPVQCKRILKDSKKAPPRRTALFTFVIRGQRQCRGCRGR